MRAKNVGKKSSENKCNKRFLYSHEYRDLKMGGEKRAKQFFQKTRIVRAKTVGKNRRKKCKKRFLYSHEYRDQKIGGKSARNNFSRISRVVLAKNGKKSSEKVQNTFFKFTRIS